MKKFVCDRPWTHFEVNNPNGDVTMCCDNNTVLGNVNEGSVEEIWNGQAFQKMRCAMRDKGAHAICPHTCPVLHGNKQYQQLDWGGELDPEGPARKNADLNDREFAAYAPELESLPRWMRFTYSYACNLDCYHCYQREDATQHLKLPTRFMDEVRRLSPVFQAVFPFGGEPFLFKPVLDYVETADVDANCRFFFVTNATLLNDRIFAMLRKRNLGMIAVSLDAATEESFEQLRKRGRTADWSLVMENLKRLQTLKAEKNFAYTISMTVNSVNHDEVERFVDLGLAHDAEPLLILVSNPYQTREFQKSFLTFNSAQTRTLFEQIDRGLAKVRERGFVESERSLLLLRGTLKEHLASENQPGVFLAKKWARSVFHCLPGAVQEPIRTAVQSIRTRSLARRVSE